MTQRFWRFDNARYFLILLVVLGHLIDIKYHGNPSFTSSGTSMPALFLFIYSFHMPAFIFLSGLFTREQGDSPDIARIASFVCSGFLIKFIQFSARLITTGSTSFSLLSDSSVPWYMFALAWFTLFAWVFRKMPTTVVLLFSLAISLLVGYDSQVGDFLYLSRTLYFFPFFWIGYRLTPRSVDSFFRNKRWLKLVGAAVLVVFAISCLAFLQELYPLRGLLTGRNPYSAVGSIEDCGAFHRGITYVLSSILTFSFLSIVPRRRLPLITRIGSQSVSIYAWHYAALLLLFTFGADKVFQLICGDYWKYAALSVAPILTVLLSNEFFAKPFNWFSKGSFLGISSNR